MPSLGETIARLSARQSRAADRVAPGRLTDAQEFGANPGNLAMRIYVPSGLRPAAPLVIVLHGCTQTAEAYAEGAGWLDLADRYGFVVLCPEQKRANNPSLCFNWFQPADTTRGQGEAASIHTMIVRTIAANGLDPGRVFITGLSAGGAMANVMLATYPETFKAGAIIAGLPYGAASNMAEAFNAMSGQIRLSGGELAEKVRAASSHRGPWPKVSVWQGDQDMTVRPTVATAVAAQWVDVHGAKSAPSSCQQRHLVRRWNAGVGDPAVELHNIVGMGHGAPLSCSGDDACGRAGPFLLDVGVSSSVELTRSWGLADLEVRTLPRMSAGTASPQMAPGAMGRRSPVDAAGVITKALKAAGLM